MANSVYSQEFATYHRKIVKELDRLKEDKNSYKHENKKDRIKDLIFGIDETLCNNKVFDKFYDVAWDHCDDINVAKQKLDELLVELIRELEQAIIIKNGNIVIQFLTEISKRKFSETKNELIEMAKNILFKRTGSFIKSTRGKVYDIVPIERNSDAFGSWEFDPLFGHLKLYFMLTEEIDFPETWRTDSKTTAIKVDFKTKDWIAPIVRDENEFSLEKFLRDEIPITNQNELDVIAKYLESRGICDVKSLIQVENWDRIQQDLPAVCNRLKTIVEQRKNNRAAGLQTARTRERTNGEELSDLNKCYRFLLFEASSKDRLAKMGYLNPDALNEGFNEQANDPEFDGGPVLGEIKQKLEVFTQEKKMFRSTSHGMILYGPPGTGKTHLCTVIIQKFGLFGLVEPLSSSELNRSLVGQTEQLLMAMFHRATYVPYLLCCIAIDEIDALVPKRSEKSAEHKVDVLSLLLSLIGGIKDVPNVFVIASTNRLNKIDDAFARRLQDKFYVGRLTAEHRYNMIKKIYDKKFEQKICLKSEVIKLFEKTFENPKRRELFNLLTTNFTGAAMCALKSQLLLYFDMNPKENKLSDDLLIWACKTVANNFQIKLGGYSIPEAIKDIIREQKEEPILTIKPQDLAAKLTGRIIIDLRSDFASIQLEMLQGEIHEIYLDSNKFKFTSDLLPILIKLSIQFKVPLLHLIDSPSLLLNSAYDENSSLETIREKLNEYEQYDDSMVVFDIDTLVGILESMSDSSMSESISYSIQSNQIWQKVIVHNFKMPFGVQENSKHKWCILISASEFLIGQLKRLTKFPFSKREIDFQVRERTCIQCGEKYVEKYNKSDACTYHARPLLKRIVGQSSQQISITKEDLIALASKNGTDEVFNYYYYLCCMKKFSSIGDKNGCLTGRHRDI